MFCADTWAGRTHLAGRTLKLRVGALADPALAVPTTVTDLPVLGDAGGVIHGAVAGAAHVVVVTDAHPTLAAPMAW